MAKKTRVTYCWKVSLFSVKMTLIVYTLSQPLSIKLNCFYSTYHFLERSKIYTAVAKVQLF